MLKRTLLPLIVAWMLTACAAGAPPIAAPALIPPAHLTEPPPATLPEPASDHLDDLLLNHIETAGLYHRTRERFQGLINWLEKTHELR
ncbi:MAG: hypothetical protein A3H93_09165 [Rhodocyclales bacterium RIFCSPLOWO2_02_FULL_63_24]|nr:MAG: hypothetical protein A3H93_09165 [Rhodocyclales bacterium RIFCSPLOWO2_02_FULL_63_24]